MSADRVGVGLLDTSVLVAAEVGRPGMRAYLTASGQRVSANDLWIAATAAARSIPVVTQDHDFYALSGVNGLTVVEV